jgi:hypothetical protein
MPFERFSCGGRIYDDGAGGMADAAGAWLRETMNDCAYVDHVAGELESLEQRLAQGRASGADVYVLQNFDALIECALRDSEVHDGERRRRNTAFDRNCMVLEGRARELHTWVAVMVGRVQTMLAAAGDGGDAGDAGDRGDAGRLRQGLDDVRDMADGILRDVAGGSNGGRAKKPRTDVKLHGGARELLQMSALLAQMRA